MDIGNPLSAQIYIQRQGVFRVEFRPLTSEMQSTCAPGQEHLPEYAEITGGCTEIPVNVEGERANVSIDDYYFGTSMQFRIQQGSRRYTERARSVEELQQRLRAQGRVEFNIQPASVPVETGISAGAEAEREHRTLTEIQREYEVTVPLPTYDVTQL